MTKENGSEPKIEQEMVQELRPLSPEERVRLFGDELAALRRKYGIVLAVVTNNVTPAYAVTQLQILPQEQVRQG